MSDNPNKAVFLSYASQDAEAAKRVADALRAAGVEVWFDQNELVGGDQWDQKIRGQISSCTLFVPVISANTQARLEGYFRLEWKLAAQRTHTMADEMTFLLPVLVDGTRDAEAKVPAEFRAVQWTKLPGGEATPAFCARVKKLLSGEPAVGGQRSEVSGQATQNLEPRTRNRRLSHWWWLAPIFGMTMALALVLRENRKELVTPPATPAAAPLSAARQLAAKARELLAAGRVVSRETLAAADDLAEQARKLDPTDAEVLATSAQVDAFMVYRGFDISEGRRQSAAKRAQRALALAPGSFEARHARAVVAGFLAASPEMLAESEHIYRELWQEQPANNVVGQELGRVLQEAGRPADAAAVFLQARQPLDAGWAYFAGGQFQEADKVADRLLAEKRDALTFVLKANIQLFGFGDLAAAQAAIGQLTPTELMNDDAAGIALRLAVVQRDAPRLLQLLGAFANPFVSIGGVNYPRQYWTGYAQQMLAHPDATRSEWRGALQAVEERLKSNAADAESLGWVAMLQAMLGEKEAAERALRLYLNYTQFSPGRWDWFAGLTILHLGGRNDEVLDLLASELRRPQGHRMLYLFARSCPEFDPLRGDPRFEALLRETLPAGMKPLTAATDPAAGPIADDKSVAVLAFANLSDDKANEYFSDGISEELLNVLAKVPGLKVTARTSSFHFKGTNTAIPEIAQQLGVAYVVEGSVRKAGDKVRITAQLIKAADGFHVWSDTFTRDLKDIFAVQDEIAGLVAKNLEAKLGTTARSGAMVDGQAFELYMQGRAAWNRRNAEGFARAETLLRQALEIAPDFARAHAALADVWMIRAITEGKLSLYGQRDSPVIAPIEAEVQRALELDPDSAEAHATLGFLRELQHRPDEALRLLRRSVELNPNYATGHHWLAGALEHRGLFDEGFREYERAVAIDPLSPRILDNYGASLSIVGRFKEALGLLERSLDLMPDQPQALFRKVLTLAQLGRRDEARALAPRTTAEYRKQVVAAIGDQAEIAAALIHADRADRFLLLCAAGRPDEALNFFHADDVSLEDAPEWFFEPRLVPFHQDPRFLKVITELGFEDAFARAQAWRKAHPPEPAELKP